MPLGFHLETIGESLRIAREVRIFPLLDLSVAMSPYVDSVMEILAQQGYIYSVEKVNYAMQRGGNEMLIISHRE